jgi:hypothetical protein
MARWSSIPRFLAFATLAGAMLAAVVAAGIAVVAPRTGAAVPDRRWPGPPPSVVFGPDGAPTAGNVTVGLLVPAAPPRRLLDLVPPDVLAAFEAAEAARGDADDKPDAGPGAFDVEDDTARLRERADAAYERAKVLAAVSATLLRETGVDFVFVDLLAADAHAVPLVLVDGAVRFPGDAAALREAIRLGTRVVRTEAEGEDVGEVDPAAIHAPLRADATASLVARCHDLLRTSRAILRLPHDPLEVLEARRDGDDVVVRFRDPPAAAALRDLEDRVVATAAVAPDGTVRVRCPDPALDPFRHRLVVTAATRVRWRAAPTVPTSSAPPNAAFSRPTSRRSARPSRRASWSPTRRPASPSRACPSGSRCAKAIASSIRRRSSPTPRAPSRARSSSPRTPPRAPPRSSSTTRRSRSRSAAASVSPSSSIARSTAPTTRSTSASWPTARPPARPSPRARSA